MNSQHVKVLAALDQGWAEMDDRRGDIAALMLHGVRSPASKALLQNVLLLVLGEVCFRRSVKNPSGEGADLGDNR